MDMEVDTPARAEKAAGSRNVKAPVAIPLVTGMREAVGWVLSPALGAVLISLGT
jgi:hypothetical protein